MFCLLIFCIYEFENYKVREINRETWKSDFEFIVDKLERYHPDPFGYISKNELNVTFSVLASETDNMSKEEVAFEIGRVLALIKDGHTSLKWTNYKSEYYYPVRFEIISDNVYIRKIADDYNELLFKKVKTINGKPIEEVIETISKYCAGENEYFIEAGIENSMFSYRFLKTLKLLNTEDNLIVGVEDDSDIIEKSIMRVTYDELIELGKKQKTWEYNYGVRNYNYEYLPEHKILIVRFSSSFEDENMSIESFNDALWKFESLNEVDKMVVDLSFNSGGYPYVFNTFFKEFSLSEYNQKGKSFVIIGHNNYSAGTIAASMMRRLTDAELIGEPTGGAAKMNFNTELFETPNMNIEFSIAKDRFECLPNSDEKSIYPDVLIVKEIEDYANDIDPNIQYVIEH